MTKWVCSISKFNEVLKSLREKEKLTQQEMADILNITQSSYQKYEKGSREPNMETLLIIAEYFNVSLDILFGRYIKAENTINDLKLRKCG